MITICPYCGSKASLVDSAIVYGRSYGNIYLCDNYPQCKAWVGVHKGTDKPLGRLADAELRELKKRAHSLFDPIWQTGTRSRHQSYKKLAKIMGIPRKECHIGMFDKEQCLILIDILSDPKNPVANLTYEEKELIMIERFSGKYDPEYD